MRRAPCRVCPAVVVAAQYASQSSWQHDCSVPTRHLQVLLLLCGGAIAGQLPIMVGVFLLMSRGWLSAVSTLSRVANYGHASSVHSSVTSSHGSMDELTLSPEMEERLARGRASGSSSSSSGGDGNGSGSGSGPGGDGGSGGNGAGPVAEAGRGNGNGSGSGNGSGREEDGHGNGNGQHSGNGAAGNGSGSGNSNGNDRVQVLNGAGGANGHAANGCNGHSSGNGNGNGNGAVVVGAAIRSGMPSAA